MTRHEQWILKAIEYQRKVTDSCWMGKMVKHLLLEIANLREAIEVKNGRQGG